VSAIGLHANQLPSARVSDALPSSRIESSFTVFARSLIFRQREWSEPPPPEKPMTILEPAALEQLLSSFDELTFEGVRDRARGLGLSIGGAVGMLQVASRRAPTTSTMLASLRDRLL
jgi:hypothetical protein